MTARVQVSAGAVLALVAVVGVGLLWVVNRRAIGAAAASAVEAVNPASDKNLVYRGVSAAGSTITGDASWSLGGQLAEWLSPEVRAANASMQFVYPDRVFFESGGGGVFRGSGATGEW